MTDHPLHFDGLIEVGRRIQSRELSAVEVTRTMLERIDSVDTTLNSFVTVMADSALEQAAQADRDLAAGIHKGPLQGVPVAVKDLLWTAGTRTTHGMPLHRDHVPRETASVVTRLDQAGAVLLGKLQQTEGAFADHHPYITPPTNPWGETLWSGASSSGSGVATAAGLCFGSLGTDTGGSIRFPSAANGVTGLKPSWGRVSRHGAFELAASMDHIGPIARSAADAGALLGVIAGADERDPTAVPLAVPDYLAGMTRGLKGLRIGRDPHWAIEAVDNETRGVLEQVVSTLGQLGAVIEEIDFPDTQQAVFDWAPLCGVETAVAHAETFPSQREAYGPGLAGLIDLGRAQSAMDHQQRLLRRAEFKGRVDRLLASIDLLIAPVTAYAAPSMAFMEKFGEDEALFSGMLRYTCPFDLSGHPAITLPAGFSQQGGPIAFQFIAPMFDEAMLVRAGWAFQQVTDWHRRHPEL